MDVREVRAEYRKTISDGDYGNETYSVALVATLDTTALPAPDDPAAVAHALAVTAHDVVVERLRRSTSERIRMALETPQERELRRERERAEREAERERWRLRAEQEEAERVARHGPLPEPDDDDDDPGAPDA